MNAMALLKLRGDAYTYIFLSLFYINRGEEEGGCGSKREISSRGYFIYTRLANQNPAEHYFSPSLSRESNITKSNNKLDRLPELCWIILFQWFKLKYLVCIIINS